MANLHWHKDQDGFEVYDRDEADKVIERLELELDEAEDMLTDLRDQLEVAKDRIEDLCTQIFEAGL